MYYGMEMGYLQVWTDKQSNNITFPILQMWAVKIKGCTEDKKAGCVILDILDTSLFYNIQTIIFSYFTVIQNVVNNTITATDHWSLMSVDTLLFPNVLNCLKKTDGSISKSLRNKDPYIYISMLNGHRSLYCWCTDISLGEQIIPSMKLWN